MVLVLTACLMGAAVCLGRRFRDRAAGGVVLWSVRALALGTVLPHHYIKTVVDGRVLLDLCDLAGIAAVVCVFVPQEFLTALLFYWGLTLTPHALLTPDFAGVFPSTDFYLFFGPHLAVMVTAAYVVWVKGRGITWRHYRAAVGATILLAAATLAWNMATGANYMYLLAKPASGSILDYFGPWPVYILVEACLTIALWALITLPFQNSGRSRGVADAARPSASDGKV
jgi:hypothetical integral membrane protein (TIGR02206 family)